MAGQVPFARSLDQIYTADALPTQAKRWNHLLTQFQAIYNQPAEFVARSPGRVNIIGEHIDYSLYSVLPMAITADALLAVSTSVDPASVQPGTYRVEIANVQSARFPPHAFDIPLDAVDVDASVHEWTNYFKSGLRGALELLRKKHGPDYRPASMRILMDGTVPAGGGLSSSAAFTSTSALAVMVANGETAVDKTELTELAIVSERAVGVNSGGMDQSASVFSERGSALFVSFAPRLTARPVSFPRTRPELCFLIAQSFVAADKHVTGPIHYNLRVVECSLAAAYLHAALNADPAADAAPLPADASPLGVSLRGFHDAYFAAHPDAAARAPRPEDQLRELIRLAEATLPRAEGYTRDEVAARLGVSVADLDARFTSRFPVRAERFRLRQRALHVFREALRVLEFMALLEDPSHHPAADASSSSSADDDTTAYNERLGALLNATQDSCRDDYECSCPEIDDLCRIARAAGSYGSRLTGAGWGGCSVHLVPADRVASVRAAWDREYYAKRELTDEQREAAVVESRPGSGSAVYVVAEGTL